MLPSAHRSRKQEIGWLLHRSPRRRRAYQPEYTEPLAEGWDPVEQFVDHASQAHLLMINFLSSAIFLYHKALYRGGASHFLLYVSLYFAFLFFCPHLGAYA